MSPVSQQVETVTAYEKGDEFLKIIAYIFMVVDHVYMICLPSRIEGRLIGRMAMPIFFYLLCKGWKRSRSVKKYGLRLLIWGLVSQVILMLLGIKHELNILLSMALALGMLEFCRQEGAGWVICFAALAEICNFEYGAYGISVAFLMQYLGRRNWVIAWAALHLAAFYRFGWLQPLAVYAPYLILQFKSVSVAVPKAPKDFWYICYPMQWAVIKMLSVIA